jgi:hypothetical protein
MSADTKRKAAILAGGAAAVVVVAVVVFLVLSNGSGTDKSAPPAGQQPQTSNSAGVPNSVSNPPSSPPVAGLGQTPTEGKVTDFGGAGKMVANGFFNNPSGGWSYLTPAAQAAYGDQQAFQQYWANNKISAYSYAHADSGTNNADGSLTMNLTVNGIRRGYRVVLIGGQMLIDSDTRLEATGTPNQ